MQNWNRPGDPDTCPGDYGKGDHLNEIWGDEEEEDVEIELKPISDEEFIQDVKAEERRRAH